MTKIKLATFTLPYRIHTIFSFGLKKWVFVYIFCRLQFYLSFVILYYNSVLNRVVGTWPRLSKCRCFD